MMARKGQRSRTQSDQKPRRRVPTGIAEETPSDLVEGVHLPDGHVADPGGASVETQAAQLGDARLLGAQRQALAVRIGRLQGNRHLQKVVSVLKASLPETASLSFSESALEGRTDSPAAPGGGSRAMPRPQAVAASPADQALQRQEAATANQTREMFEEAMNLYVARRFGRAIRLFERVRQTPGVSEEVRRDCLYNIGRCNLRLERYATAIMYLEEYLAMEGADVEGAEADLREAKEGAGIPVEGGEAGAGAEISADQAREMLGRAISVYAQGRNRAAVILLERLRQTPGIPEEMRRECVISLGRANLRMGRYATAIIYLEKYLAMQGAEVEKGEVLLRRARQSAGVQVEEERPGRAVPPSEVTAPGETAEAGAQVPADRARAMFEEAMRLYGDGNYGGAIRLFERVRQTPGVSEEVRRDCLYNIGRCNLRLERYATAIIYLEEYVAMEGADVEGAEADLREAKEGAGIPVEGGEAGAGAEISADQAREMLGRAISVYAQGRNRAAVILLERLRQTPGIPEEMRRECVISLGRANLRMGRYATAIIYLEKYLAMRGAEVEKGEVLLRRARQGAGVPTEAR